VQFDAPARSEGLEHRGADEVVDEADLIAQKSRPVLDESGRHRAVQRADRFVQVGHSDRNRHPGVRAEYRRRRHQRLRLRRGRGQLLQHESPERARRRQRPMSARQLCGLQLTQERDEVKR
jgi:hypothetical protein